MKRAPDPELMRRSPRNRRERRAVAAGRRRGYMTSADVDALVARLKGYSELKAIGDKIRRSMVDLSEASRRLAVRLAPPHL